MKKMMIGVQLVIAVFLIAACNVNQADEAVEQNDNPEVANLVNREDGHTQDNNDARLNVEEEVADRIANLDEVEHAWVFVSAHNAFVAVNLKDTAANEIPSEVKEKVTKEVEEADLEGVEHVYVSSNPDFTDRMAEYGNRVKEGEPVEGLANEFNQVVDRIFPDKTT
ncbi:YhcN/YlaJ family sporulation lipoprotein [Jeotgalibacillus proteolyticus]|uniref:Lipoprotein YhcN n=1 Tax=Jeotgalibacillus proteolyticus TaxID=2082395 RepID=A0A2S5G7N0_9BACL|nr:YhcN/YlaJ family sporulation lipoprotein [Jeotgalibacillus proteolyticus]PPA68931.1 lipoprotein YhcN [Jeotgalibacillus proteolyticus]